MRDVAKLLSVALMLVLALVAVVSVSGLEVEEASLPGTTYEVNPGVSGGVYVSNYGAGELWHVGATGTYTVYEELYSIRDAKPDAAGDIWFTDYYQSFGRIDVSSQTVDTWTLPGAQNLGGLTFDAGGKVWLTQWFGQAVYSFDPVSTHVCTYTLPLGIYSEYIINQGDYLWVANYSQERLYRLDGAANQLVYWEIGDAAADPLGLGLDGDGGFWWADTGMDVLARLNPDTSLMTTYDPPEGTEPKMFVVRPDGVWYTEYTDDVGSTFGLLRPGEATGTSTELVKTGPNGITPVCSTEGLGPGDESEAVTRTGNMSWASADYVPVVDENGWTVYQVPAGSTGDGLYGIAYSGTSLWIGDRGREKLLRFEPSVQFPYQVFLPLILSDY